jgi:hemerythrin-like domain-containing protein
LITMKPIAPLMIEHRIIERMINIIEKKVDQLKTSKKLDPIFIDTAVEFIRVYADETHHGKEEQILFRELAKKDLKPAHQRILQELIEEHKIGRSTTQGVVKAKEAYLNGDSTALTELISLLEKLIDFYPKHIEKEDKHFFIPVMNYFSEEEQQHMLKEGHAFDRKMIHVTYERLIKKYESALDLPNPMEQSPWLDFI